MEHNGSTLTPRNWTKFQHYHDRNPTWIKLQVSLLDDPDFMELPSASQLLCILLWLMASKYTDGIITACNEKIAWRLRMPTKELEKNLAAILSAGYFISSNSIATPEQASSAEKEKNRDKEETDNKARPSSQSEVEDFCASIGLPRSDGEAMWLDWVERGYGKTRDWKAKIQKWKIHGYLPSQKQQGKQKQPDPNQSRKDEQYAVFLRERAERKAALNG